MKKWYIDIPSVVAIGYDEGLRNFSWPLSFGVYSAIAKDFIDSLVGLFNDVSLSSDNRILLNLKAIDIIQEFNIFVTVLLNVNYAKQHDLEIIFNKHDSWLYQYMLEDSFGERYPGLDRYIERKIDSRIAKIKQFSLLPYVKYYRLCLHKFFSGKTYKYMLNKLLRQYDHSRQGRIDSILFVRPFRYWASSGGINDGTKDLMERIYEIWVSVLRKHQQEISCSASRYVFHLIKKHISIAQGALGYNFGKFINFNKAMLLTGSGGKFLTRLLSFIFQREGCRVMRFAHGGDRSIYSDISWAILETSFCNTYVAHGALEALRIRERQESKALPVMYFDEAPEVTSFGSISHRTLYEKYATAVAVAKSKLKVMVVMGSFNGLYQEWPNIAYLDMVYIEWQFRLIKILKDTGCEVIVKRHPKSLYTQESLFSSYCDKEIIGVSFCNCLDAADVFVFDYGTSAFVEALCAMRNVVLIDIGYRFFNQHSKSDLNTCCHIVKAHFDENNRIMVDHKVLLQAIEAPFNMDARRKTVHEYWLNATR